MTDQELSEKVALALGWIKPFSPENRAFFKDMPEEVRVVNNMNWITPEGTTADSPKPFANNIQYCFRDLEPLIPGFEISHIPDGRWVCSWDDEDDPQRQTACADTAPRAICLAFLQVKGVK